MSLTGLLALLVMQVGPNPSLDAYPGTPEELRNRPPREGAVIEAPDAQPSRLAQCLQQARRDPQGALDFAQGWREQADSDNALANSSHCAGLALVQLGRFGEARQVFLAGRDEAGPNAAYRARLGAMAGHAALADGEVDAALPDFEFAAADARASGDASLRAGIEIDRAGALVALGRGEDAAGALTEARSLDPDNARAWLFSATLSRRLERLGEAQEQIERAAALDPADPAIGLEAGVIAATSGRQEDAIRSFESVRTVAPGSPEATRAEAYLAQLNGAEPGPQS